MTLSGAEDAVRENEARLKSILEGSPLPQFVIDNDHRVISWNRTIEEFSGIKAADVLGTTDHWKAFYPQQRPVLADLLVDEAIEHLPEWYEGKYKHSRLVDGAYEATDFFPRMGESGRWLYFTAAPIRDAKGTIIGAVETLQDISDQKKAEGSVRESEARLKSILEGTPLLQFVIDKTHRVISWNRAIELYSGIKAADVLGTTDQWRAFYFQQRPVLADLLVDEAIEHLPEWYEGKYTRSPIVDGAYEATDFFPIMGGSGKWLYFTAAPIRDANGAIIGSVETLQDITGRKQAEIALKESNERFLAFIKEAAMRLKNPLEVVEENLSLVIDDIEQGQFNGSDSSLQLKIQIRNLEQIRKNIIELNKAILERSGVRPDASTQFLTE